MIKSKYYPLNIGLEYVLSIFEVNSNLSYKVNDNEFILFEIYDLDKAKEVEDIFLGFSNTKKRIITNHQGKKPLILSFRFRQNRVKDMWEFLIYQKKSRGIILNKFSTTESLPLKLFEIIKPIENDISYNKKFVLLENNFNNTFKKHEMEVFLLKSKDLKIISSRSEITSFEKKQILFTYVYYNSMYDENVSKIDDNDLYKTTLSLNKKVKPILDEVMKCMLKYKIERT